MSESFPVAVGSRRRPGGFLFRTGRRTLAESLYLLTAPASAAAGLLLVAGGLCVAMVGLLLGAGRASWPAALRRRGGSPTWSGGGSLRFAPGFPAWRPGTGGRGRRR